MGVIDVLQAWNMTKRMERWAKIVIKGRVRQARLHPTLATPEPKCLEHRGLIEPGREILAGAQRHGTLGALRARSIVQP